MIKPEVLDAMLASGCTAEQIVAAVKASMTSRTKNAERQARYRERHVTSRNVTERNETVEPLSPLAPLDKETSPRPPKEINPPLTPQPQKRRGSRLPDDFKPDLDFAIGKGLTSSQANTEADKFRNYWQAKAGANAAKLDWPATWRNWAIDAADRLPRAGPVNGKPVLFADKWAALERYADDRQNSDSGGGAQEAIQFLPPVSAK